jgi:hypothetical protein
MDLTDGEICLLADIIKNCLEGEKWLPRRLDPSYKTVTEVCAISEKLTEKQREIYIKRQNEACAIARQMLKEGLPAGSQLIRGCFNERFTSRNGRRAEGRN